MSDETSAQDQLMDLANKSSRSTVAVIDAMTQRGAFKGEELSTIGGLRDQCIQVIQLWKILNKKPQWNLNSTMVGRIIDPREATVSLATFCLHVPRFVV